MRDDFGDSSRVAIAAFPSFSCSLTSGSLSLRRSCRGDEGKLALGPRVEEAELGVGWSLEDGGGWAGVGGRRGWLWVGKGGIVLLLPLPPSSLRVAEGSLDGWVAGLAKWELRRVGLVYVSEGREDW